MSSLDINNLFSVRGKTAVITGGASGLGESMATAFVVNGGNVIIASRKEKALAETCDKLNALKTGGKASYVVADISTKAGCETVAEGVKKLTDKIHVLVANAGATWGGSFNDFPEKEGWDRIFALNVKSIFYLASFLTPLLAKDASNIDPGRIIVISSVAGLSANATDSGLAASGMGLWSYNASKAAAISLSNTLATSLAPKFITSNAICPGVYPTKMTRYAVSKQEKALNASHPMGRMGTPEDIAGLFIALVSRAGSHLSANFVVSDGGALAGGRGYSKM